MRKSKYSKEFKDSTIQLIINNNESVVKVAQDLDLNEKTLYHWVTTYKKEHNIPTRSVNNIADKEPLELEVKRLRYELKIAKQDVIY